ncbi:hypothetical protein [Micromonospora sp. NPDC049679]|uniref:hypothetical protein n=1 Tax=Micromonospora sp. NPDC049679 TaxID=3155920 RepID=UPI003404ABB1
MVETTPPGRGSRLLGVDGANPLYVHVIGNKVDDESDVESCAGTYTRQSVEFHLRNANAWASDRVGEDLAAQVDPDSVLGPEPLVR